MIEQYFSGLIDVLEEIGPVFSLWSPEGWLVGPALILLSMPAGYAARRFLRLPTLAAICIAGGILLAGIHG